MYMFIAIACPNTLNRCKLFMARLFQEAFDMFRNVFNCILYCRFVIKKKDNKRPLQYCKS